MGDKRRDYQVFITLNKRRFDRVVIDPHYEKNHPDITDQLILEPLKLLDGRGRPTGLFLLAVPRAF